MSTGGDAVPNGGAVTSDDSADDGTGDGDESIYEKIDWLPVAKKEFEDAIRSKGLWFLAFVFTALFVLPAARVWWNRRGGGGQQLSRQAVDIGMQFFISRYFLDNVTILMSIVVLFASYAAISKERETGSLKLLLSLPFSRRDVIVGKVLGRSAVVAVPGAIAFLLTGAFFLLSPFAFKPLVFLWFALFTLVLVVVLTAIAVSISGAVSKSVYSLAGSVLVYLYLNFAWNSLANGLGNLLADYVGIGTAMRWRIVLFVKLLNPMQAFKTLTNSMLSERANAAQTARFSLFQRRGESLGTICGDVLGGDPATVQGVFGNQTVCEAGSSGLPLYFSDPAVFVYMLAWIGLAAAVSYYTFDRVDL